MTRSDLQSCLYKARVMHARLRPFSHKFKYQVFTSLIDLDELDEIDRRCRLFSINKFNLFSFHAKDFGDRSGSSVKDWVLGVLSEKDIDIEGGSVRLLNFPRILGYAFNPISVYYCHHSSGELRAIIYGVSNTFGECHSYVVPIEPGRNSTGMLSHDRKKVLHVSPFIDMAPRYRFRIKTPDEKLSFRIKEDDANGELLIATLNGDREVLRDRQILAVFLRYPLMIIKVMGGIHWEALKLWLRGAKFIKSAEPPENDYSF